MHNRDLVVIGASAGGLEPMRRIFSGLRPTLPASVLVTQHLAPQRPSMLQSILARAGNFPVVDAEDGMPLELGRAYVARPDCHLLVTGNRLALNREPQQNGVRPAIDVLFCSAAARGRAAVGVLLSGTLDDGTFGLHVLKQAGGATIVQDPLDAEFAEMPANAIDNVAIDHVVPASAIAALLHQLTEEALPPLPAVPADVGAPADLPTGAVYICPDCGGPLQELAVAGLQRYRCELGHQYAPQALLASMGMETLRAVWSALRLHHDQLRVYRRLAERTARSGNPSLAERLHRRIAELERHEAALRKLVSAMPPTIRRDPPAGSKQ